MAAPQLPPGFVLMPTQTPEPPPGFVIAGDPAATDEPMGVGAQLKRAASIAGRDTLEGVGGLVGIVTDPLVGLTNLAGGNNMTTRQSMAWLADKIGLEKPATPSERVGSGISQALIGGGGMMGTGKLLAQSASPVASGVGNLLQTAPGAQTLAAVFGPGAAGLVREEGGGEGAQAVAGLLGALAPTVLPAATSAAVRGVARGGEAGRQQMQAVIDDFSAAGTSPTLGQAAPGNAGKLAEAVVRNAPGGAGVVRQRLDAQAGEIAKRVDDLASQLSPAVGAEKGGAAIIRGITGPGGFMQRFRAKSSELYDEVQRLLPPDTTVPAKSSSAALAKLTAPIQGAESTSAILQNPKIARIASAFGDDLAANGGTINYDALKRLRTQVGELIDDSVLTPDAGTRQLRQLYVAMSDDMTLAARATNDPAVIRAATRANDYYAAAMKRVEALERVVAREGGGPEAVYRSIFANSREGGTTLRKVMQSLDGAQQKDLAAATLRRMGRANPGAQDDLGEVFSPETFLTNWNKMAPEAKNALFDRFGGRYRSDLDKIAAATAKMREAGQVLANPSGTAPLGAQVTAYGALGGLLMTGNAPGAATVAAGIGMSNLAARAFTNPRIVRWLAKQTMLPVQAVPASINELSQMAKDDKEAKELLDALNSQPNIPTTL